MAEKKNKAPKAGNIPAAKSAPRATEKPSGFPKMAIVGVLLLTAILYMGALQNGITFIDDDMYLLKNPYIRNFSMEGVRAIFTSFYEFNYHPLTTLTYLIEYKFFQLEPLPYHAFNVILHLVNTWLVYMLAMRLSGKAAVGFIVSLLFGIHPLHVESVAWISERKGLLCALFYLSSLLFYVRYIDLGLKKKHYAIAALLFLGALLSKSAAVTLPLLLIGIDIYRGRKITAAVIAEKVPLLLLSVLFGVLAIMSQSAGGAIKDVTVVYGFVNRIFLFTSGLAFYFIKLLVPTHLSAIHYFPNLQANGALEWQYYASLPLLLLVGWLAARKSAYRKEIIFGLFFFLISISVMLQLITVGAAIAAERYSYVSYFGLFYIVGQLLTSSYNRFKTPSVVLFSVMVLVFCTQTWNRVPAWKDTETIFTDILNKNEGNKNNYLVHYHWGEYFQWRGMQQESIPQYDTTVAIEPKCARAYMKRGEAYEWTKNVRKAIENYNQAIRLDPKSAMAYNNNGWAHFENKDIKSAIAYLDTAIKLDPKLANAFNNRGWVLLQSGDSVSAMRDFDKAILISPTFTRPYFNRAIINVNSGKTRAAIEDYTKVLRIVPGDDLAYYYRGLCYLDMNNKDFAASDLRHSAQLGNVKALEALQQIE